MTGPTPSPESPAVQDTDRLREVAAEAEGLRRNGPASDDRGWYRTAADRVECFAIAGAVLAAVLPVHRAQVLREMADELRRRAPRLGEARRAGGIRYSAAVLLAAAREPAASAPPTPPGSPPADERATAVETGRAEDDGGYEPFVASEGWTEEPAAATIDPPGIFRLRRRSPEDQALYFTTKLLEITAERDRLARELETMTEVARSNKRHVGYIAEQLEEMDAEASRLYETIRKVRELAEAEVAAPGHPQSKKVHVALLFAALGDVPSPTAPEAPDDLDRFIAEQMHDPEFRAAWERQAGRPLLDEATARAAGWLPLNEVLAVLRDDEGMWEWASQFGPSRNACIVSISERELLAVYLSDRLAPQPADTKETTTDDPR